MGASHQPQISERVALFLNEAGPILAAERGMNARARMLLDALGKKYALTELELENGILTLQKNFREGAAPNPSLDSFRQLLQVQFKNSTTKILTLHGEQILMELATEQLHLEPHIAREEVRHLSQELGMKRVTREEAERFITEAIVQKLGTSGTMPHTQYARLEMIARDWGIDSPTFAALVKSELLKANTTATPGGKQSGIIVGIATALGIVIVALLFVYWRSRETIPEALVPQNQVKEMVTLPITADKLPSWWTVEMAVAYGKIPQWYQQVELEQASLLSAAVERRALAYDWFFDKTFQPAAFNVERWHGMMLFYQHVVENEPENNAALRAIRAWGQGIRKLMEQVPRETQEYDHVFLPMESFQALLMLEKLPEERRSAAIQDWERITQQPFTDADLTCTKSYVAIVLMGKLEQQLPQNANVLKLHYAFLASIIREHAAPKLANAQAVLAAVAAAKTPQNFAVWRNMATQAIAESQGGALLQLIAAIESCSVAEVKTELTQQLLGRFHLTSANLPDHEKFARIRQAAGVKSNVQNVPTITWESWQRATQSLLTPKPPAPRDVVVNLRETLKIAWYTNMTIRLLNGEKIEAGLMNYQQPEIKSTSDSVSPSETDSADNLEKPLSSEQRETLRRYAIDLGHAEKIELPRRLSYLRGLAKFTEQQADIPYTLAAPIARYLLSKTNNEERKLQFEALKELRRWKQLRLALADELPQSHLSLDLQTELVLRITGNALPADADTQVCALTLLQSVSRELVTNNSGNAQDFQIDALSHELANLYAERAKLLGAGLSESQNAAAGLQACLEKFKSMQQSEIQPAERLAHLTSVLAQSELQQCIVLQQALILHLCERIQLKKSESYETAISRQTNYWKECEKANSASYQLLLGERTLLGLWIILLDS